MGGAVHPGVESIRAGRLFTGPACLVCNQASIDRRYRRTADILRSVRGLSLKFLFGPEHGIYGAEQDMIGVGDQVDPATGLKVYSLYGSSVESLGPPAGSLRGIESLFFDLQDVGSRYYTFFATLVACMKACAAAGVRVVVLDRPNPLGGVEVEGNGVLPDYRSFVGVHDMPVRHGMTVGEMALMANSESSIGCDLVVVKARGLLREMYFDQTGLPWVAPSPNMPAMSTALVYPGMCLIEGTNLSEGRGATRPFELFGAPFIDPFRLCRRLSGMRLPGVVFRPDFFRPAFHKFSGEVCGGAQLHVTDRKRFRPYLTGAAVLLAVRELWPEGLKWRREVYEFVDDRPAIDLLAGGTAVREMVDSGARLSGFREMFEEGARDFRKRRRGYLLYGRLEA